MKKYTHYYSFNITVDHDLLGETEEDSMIIEKAVIDKLVNEIIPNSQADDIYDLVSYLEYYDTDNNGIII